MEIENKIISEIEQYCAANNIEDVDKFVIKIITNGFNIEKYGDMVLNKKTVVIDVTETISENKEVPNNDKIDNSKKNIYGE